MGKFSKAIAGGFGAAVANLVVPVALALLPDTITTADQFEASLRFVLYTLITGGAVWAAPKNTD